MKLKKFLYAIVLVGLVFVFVKSLIAQTPTTRKVYTNGTSAAGDTTYTLSQLQNAIDDAAQNDPCGSVILLEQNADFQAPDNGFVLRELQAATPTWDCITIRTGIDSSGSPLSASILPMDNARVDTSFRSVFASFEPTVNNSPAIRTVWPSETGAGCSAAPCVGSGWTLKWIEVGPYTNWLKGKLILLGSNKDASDGDAAFAHNPQSELAEVPQYLSLIQCDIHGDPVMGQHGGVYLSSKDTRILYSSFTDFKSQLETQAITEVNGVGPFDIEYNLVEATGENFMAGGADSKLHQTTTITSTPTTTVIPLATVTDLFSGQFISVTHGGVQYSGFTCTLSGSTCTLSKALPVTPSVGDTVEWNRMGGGYTVKYNHFYKPPEWRNDIVNPPTGVSVNCTTTGGSLAAGTYGYRLQSMIDLKANSSNAGVPARSAATTEVTGTVASGSTGKCTISFTEAANNTAGTRVWGRTVGGENQYFLVADGSSSYVDTGSAGTSATLSTTGDTWVVKNNFEMKHCDGGSPAGECLIEGNIFDTSWCCSQSMVVNFKAWNQGDGVSGKTDVSSTVRNLTFRNNWVRHGVRGINLTTDDPEGHPTGGMYDVTIENNLFTDLSDTWGGTDGAIQITTGSTAGFVGTHGCIRCTFEHNTFLVDTNDMNDGVTFTFNTTSDKAVDLVVKNNIMPRACTTATCSSNGRQYMKTFNPNNQGNGTAAWTAATSGTTDASHNVWPDASSGIYTNPTFPTASSYFPTNTALQADLVDYASCVADTDISGCALAAGSAYNDAGDDGADLGANIANIKSFTDIALSGVSSAGGSGGETGGTSSGTTGKPRVRVRIR